MRRRRPEEEPAEAAERRGAASPQHGILALQQSAGNAAVSQMLSRQAAPAGEQAVATIDLGKDVGSVPLLEVTGIDEGEIPAEQQKRDQIRFLSASGAHAEAMTKWLASGRRLPRAHLEIAGAQMTLHDVRPLEWDPLPPLAGNEAQGSPQRWTVDVAKLERTA